MAAKRAAVDLERKAETSRRREVQRGLDLADLGGPAEDPDAEQRKADWIMWYRMELFGACRTDPERRFVLSKLSGATREVQSRALGADGLDLPTARPELNRVWNRIMQRLRRG